MNKEIVTYERDINTSYMKVPAFVEDSLDVRIMLHRNLKGMIPVERCFINGQGQYWYNISGKQALDSFAKMHMLEYSFFEVLILRICEQLEVLEWNLLDGNGLLVDPQFIFMNNKGEDISFVFYPEANSNILQELQKLLEYLLTKLDHSDHEAVKGAYEIYEMTLSEGYQIQDLKNTILGRRLKDKKEKGIEKISVEIEPSKVAESECVYGRESTHMEQKENNLQHQIEEKLSAIYRRAKEILVRNPKEEIPTVIYPTDEEEHLLATVHPTVCIAATLGEPRGMLVYEGMGDYPDFELDKTICVIGKSHRARMQINRETVSHFHAKIEYVDGYYIEDMNSTNGTFINDEILNYRESRLLHSGDVIRFADVKYRFL